MDFQEKRNIRIFISSTFEDMGVERSELAKTFRELSIKARSYNVSLHAIDLRWGIRPGESVVELCLNEIENSQPFFLGIIGERYGSVPSIKEYNENLNLQVKYGAWLEDAFAEGMSYTEIEMQFGAFMEMEKAEEKGHIVFFIKDSSLRGNNPQIENLINKIKRYQQRGLCDVSDYSSVPDLINKVRCYYESELETLFPKAQLHEYQIEQLIQKGILKEKAANYIPYNNYCQELDSFVRGDFGQYYVLSGDDGVGKSSLLAFWLLQHKDDDTFRFVYNFIGDGNLKYNTETIRRQIYTEIASLYGMTGMTNNKEEITEKDISDLLFDIPMDKPLLIVLDGLSKLYRNAENEPVTLQWFPIPIDSKVKLIMSDVPDDVLAHSAIKQECIKEIKPISDITDRIKIIDDFLGDYGKKMSEEEKILLANSDNCSNCFILKTILNELIYFGKYDNISDIIIWLLESNEEGQSLFDKLLVHYENHYTRALVKDVLSLLVVSKNGLEEGDIVKMLHLRQLEWSQLFCALNLHFSKNDGKIRFAHQQIIDAVKKRYACYFDEYRRIVANYFEDKVKDESGNCNANAIFEVAYQYFKLKDSEMLYSHLSDFQQCDVLIRRDYFNTGKYWKYLIEMDANKYNIDVYEDVTNKISEEYALFLRSFSMFCFEVLCNYQAAFKYIEICRHIHIGLCGEQSVEVAIDYERMGEIVRSAGYLTDPLGQALEYYQKAYEILIDLSGDHKNEIFNNLLEMGEIMMQLNFSPNDNNPFKKAINMLNEIEVDSTVIARIIEDFANNKLMHGLYEEAREYYKDSIRFRENTVHSSHPSIANKYISIGKTYEAKENYSKAIEYYLLAKKMYEDLFGKQHDTCGRTYYIIGRVLFKTQKFEEGIKYFDDAINIWNSKLGESNAGSAEALLYKAKIYAAINKNDEPSKRARICAEKAINILEKIGGWEELINSGYDFLAKMYIKKYPKIADLYLQKIIKR